jgi:hypothetical protein
VSAPFSISPATEAIIDTSSSSAGVSGGRMVGSRAASIDFPEPGGPIISRLWPPAAATSSARLPLSWPLMSARSSSVPFGSARTPGFGRDSTCVPLKWLASWMSDDGATISISGLAQAASGPHVAGQIRPSCREFAPIAAGNTPATAAIEPSSPSSPSTVKPASESCGTAPIAAIRPSAIGRS